jgi:hypothetical protein
MCSRQHSNRLWHVPVTARLASFHHSVASYPPSAESEFGDKLEDQLKMFESLSKT